MAIFSKSSSLVVSIQLPRIDDFLFVIQTLKRNEMGRKPDPLIEQCLFFSTKHFFHIYPKSKAFNPVQSHLTSVTPFACMATLGPGTSLFILYSTSHATNSPCYLNHHFAYCLSRFRISFSRLELCILSPVPIFSHHPHPYLYLEDCGTGFVHIRVTGACLLSCFFIPIFSVWCLFDHYSLYN